MADDNDFRYVDEGVEFIRDCAREGKPFFLFQWLNSPHPLHGSRTIPPHV
jgi:hypothetical protein